MRAEQTKAAGAILLFQLAACGDKALPVIPYDGGAPDLGIMMGFPDANMFPDATVFADAETFPDAEALDSGIVDAGMMAAMCPPVPPFGIRQGDTLPQGSLQDCDGNPVDLQGLCEKKASWMFHFAGW